MKIKYYNFYNILILLNSLSPDSRKIKLSAADGFREPHMGQAKISGHSRDAKSPCCRCKGQTDKGQF